MESQRKGFPVKKTSNIQALIQKGKDLAEQREHADKLEILSSQDVGYTSKLFVQALFPYRRPESNERKISTADGTIHVYSTNGLPYGKYPRLIMAYIITQAVGNAGKLREGKISEEEARHIPLGHSMSYFLHAIGVTGRGTGGVNGNLSKIREQLIRLASSVITAQSDNGIHARGRNAQILEDWDLWFDPHDPNQGSFIESELVLTPQFFKHVAESPIPIDLNILRKLNKPRSMDLYIWITVKQYWLSKKNLDSFTFSWDIIANNFSTKALETSIQKRDFRNEIKKSLTDILALWPNAGIEADASGVTVNKTATSIQQRPPRIQLD